MEREDMVRLLQFVTGSARVPLSGFASLRGADGLCKFTISKIALQEGETKLPTASTCFNLLKLPDYKTFDELREKLLIAIRCGSAGFLFA